MARGGGVELTADLAADSAAAILCTRLLDAIHANLPGTLEGADPECLHDLRVAVRRTRSLQRELKTAFPPKQLGRFRAGFKWLQQVTGPTRDLDVYLLEFDDFSASLPPAHNGDLEVLRTLLEEHRARERRAMEKALRSKRLKVLLRDWERLLERLPEMPVGDRPRAALPVGEIAAERIDLVYGQMVKMGDRIDDASPPQALHDLRKKGKELRYLLEFFSPLFPRSVTKSMVKTLKGLQNALGRFQDREVQAEMIAGLRPELAARDGGSATAIARLVERLHEQQDDARAEFSERYAAFAAAEQRELVKRTFAVAVFR